MIHSFEGAPGEALVHKLADHSAMYRQIELDIARKLHLRPDDLNCLQQFADQPEIPICKLSSKLCLSRSRLSRILQRLENKRLIKRQIDSKDRRSIVVRATSRGEDCARGSYSMLMPYYQPILGSLKLQDLRTAMHVLQTICQHLNDRNSSGKEKKWRIESTR